MLLLTQDDACDGNLLRLPHSLEQEPVRLARALLGYQVVSRIEVDGVDLVQVDEVLDVYGSRCLWIERVELLGGDQDIAVARDFVALDDVLERNLFAILGADPLLLDAGAVGVMQLVETDVFLGCGTEKFDRDVDEPETDRPAPDGSGHSEGTYLLA